MAQCEPPENSQDRPQSLFEGAKGAKVIKLAMTTALSAVGATGERNKELVRLSTAALEAIGRTLIEEWAALKTSNQQIARIKEKAENILEPGMIQAVSLIPIVTDAVFRIFVCPTKETP